MATQMQSAGEHAVTSGTARTGEITIRQIVDRYMAEYAGRDTTRAQRLGWWVAKIGSATLADLTDDQIYFALQDLAAQRGRFWAGVDADGQTIYKAKRGPLCPATVNRYAAALGAVLTWSVKRRTGRNGAVRGVPLNADAVAVLEAEVGKHPVFCFTYRGKPIAWELTNSAWHHAIRTAGITDFRFHDLRHTWASHRQAGTSCDELKDLGGWKSRAMVDRYAKFATEHLQAAAARIEGILLEPTSE